MEEAAAAAASLHAQAETLFEAMRAFKLDEEAGPEAGARTPAPGRAALPPAVAALPRFAA